MGTTMACAQCHHHKYDPISQEDYFRFFDLMNQTQDADRRDENPRVELFIESQLDQKTLLQKRQSHLRSSLETMTQELQEAFEAWESFRTTRSMGEALFLGNQACRSLIISEPTALGEWGMAFAGVLNALLGHVAIENQVGVLQTHDRLEVVSPT